MASQGLDLNMERTTVAARENFEDRNSGVGFDFGNLDNSNYWNEGVGYKLTAEEVDDIEFATTTLFENAMECVGELVYNEEFHKRIGLSPKVVGLIKQSWERDDFSLYGRFDFSVKGKDIKLFEYNADTPTSLLESALIQYYWMKDRGYKDQFNSIHEKLIESWKFIDEQMVKGLAVNFCTLRGNPEDYRTVEYLMDTASQAGLRTKFIFMDDIGSDGRILYDLEGLIVDFAFKLYPWEWMVDEEFADSLYTSPTRWFEPPWKLLMTNKAFMVELKKMFPQSPYLLDASYDPRPGWVKKPIWSREGANITLPGQPETDGEYGDGGYIYQEYCPLPSFDGWHPMVGSWVIGDQAAGIGIREDKSLVTGNTSRFTPHWFE